MDSFSEQPLIYVKHQLHPTTAEGECSQLFNYVTPDNSMYNIGRVYA